MVSPRLSTRSRSSTIAASFARGSGLPMVVTFSGTTRTSIDLNGLESTIGP